MYPRWAPARMIALAHAGLVDLGQFSATDFPLDSVVKAVDHAASDAGAFRMTVLRP